MYKIILILILSTNYIFSNINAVVSIVPVGTFLKAIGGEKVDITVMVQPGNSPHTYEPKPSQMRTISKANLYFAIGVEFENVWLLKFQHLHPEMKIIDISRNIPKIGIEQSHSDISKPHEANTHRHQGNDPHIWTVPSNVKIIAQNIYETLVKIDVKNKKYYDANLKKFLQKIEKTDLQIKNILSKLKQNRSFMVFHPSWSYFAQAYHLKQIAIEVEGKTPKSKTLIRIIQEAKREKVNAILTQPEFSDATAKMIAKELKIPIIKVTPLASNWSENLINIAKAIAGIN